MAASKTTVLVQAPSLPVPKPLNVINRLGIKLHPESVTAAWYESECAPGFDPRPKISRSDYLRWRLACLLRGVDR